MNLKKMIGTDKVDNVIVGFIAGMLAIYIAYMIQYRYYSLGSMGDVISNVKIPILKLSLLAALLVFLAFNHFDKLNASKGVLISVVLVGIYIVYKMFL